MQWLDVFAIVILFGALCFLMVCNARQHTTIQQLIDDKANLKTQLTAQHYTAEGTSKPPPPPPTTSALVYD
ncbi:hypothetical protein ACQ0P8_16185 (plasmid) [Halodesulfovibrio aestuarii]|uniref:Uncharacterized protein n=1 Tax=Halodesulfovibrio aestuarii TaxID=126333 RepID=A0A8G2CC75_9BACT|nr:hypothetical protein [Halodesulfovibrio aestuarii]SHJ72833.1 hypothetical protein SAMN05660830_03101 [Halodesulfovibrio aestuarii]